MKPIVSMRRALEDPRLLGDVLAGDSLGRMAHAADRNHGRSAHGQERVTFTALTGRDHEPGRRSKNSGPSSAVVAEKRRAMAVLAAYIAALCEHPDLSPANAASSRSSPSRKKQAGVAFSYLAAIFAKPPFDKLKIRESLNNISACPMGSTF